MTCTSELDVDKPIRRRFSSFFRSDRARAIAGFRDGRNTRGPLPPAAAAIVVVCGGL